MSLDIAILDDEGVPSYELSVPSDIHFQLMQQADALALRQLSGLRDYYQDVDYTVQETLVLQDEAEELAAQCSGKPDFCVLLDTLQHLVRLAVNNNKAVVAIAD